MNSRDRKVLNKILTHVEHILQYTGDMHSLEQFSGDEKTVEATVFNMMQIGELAHSGLSEEIKKELSDVPWKQIYGMRNRIVHGYGEVKLTVVWETIQNDLAPLKDTLKKAVDDGVMDGET